MRSKEQGNKRKTEMMRAPTNVRKNCEACRAETMRSLMPLVFDANELAESHERVRVQILALAKANGVNAVGD